MKHALWALECWMIIMIVDYGSTCPPPTPPYGSTIIYPLKQGIYGNGSTVLFGCKQGFLLVGKPMIRCTGTTWTKSQFTCKGFCPDISHISNGQVVRSSPKVGQAAGEFLCDVNFRLIGSSRLECVNGRWNGLLPFCEKLRSCARLQAPSNGTIHGTDTTHGSTASFSCRTGFDLFGLSTLTCTNGVWSGNVPSCKAYCVKIRDPPNGRVIGTRFSHGQVVSFKCNSGYQLVGKSALRCIDGRWNSTVPTCKALLCPKPTIPSNSYIIYPQTNQINYTHGTQVFLACSDGHYLKGSPIMVCNQTVWFKKEFSCIAFCPAVPLINNAVITHITLNGGGEVEITCHTNHTLVGSSKIRCVNGRWNGTLPSCKAPCSDPGHPYQGNRIGDDFRHDKTVRFLCRNDYVMEGAQSIKCTDGWWSNTKPSCKAPCKALASPVHGRRWGNDFRHGRSVRFYCSYGYTRVGTSTVTCNDGAWGNPAPFCKGICPQPIIPYRGRLHENKNRFIDGDEVTFSCVSGYDLIGDAKMRCADRKWKLIGNLQKQPECKARCRYSGRPAHGFYITGSWRRGEMIRHGVKITYDCLPTYTMVGANMQECDNGRWTKDVPQCKGFCTNPRQLQNGVIIGNDYSYNASVKFHCNSGYELRGRASLTCLKGVWNGEFPECKSCGKALGLESTKNLDIRITSPVSSISLDYQPSAARLNGPFAWCPSRPSYLQIELGKNYKLTAIATQGGTGENTWVRRYRISFMAGNTLLTYSESGKTKDIGANTDASSVKKYTLKEPFVTSTVRIEPVTTATDSICLRTELYGCDPTPDCVLVGSMFWGMWAYNNDAYNYYRVYITKLTETHLDFALKYNKAQTKSYLRTEPVLILDEVPSMGDISVNSRVIAQHRQDSKIWYRTGNVTRAVGSDLVLVKFDDGKLEKWVSRQDIRLVKRPRFCEDKILRRESQD